MGLRAADAAPSEPSARTLSAWRGRALWTYGFRPFFLLAALSAVVTLVTLFGALHVGVWPDDAMPVARWHGHEMLFGFVAAAIAGFLLTAVPTWTNTRPVSGVPLALLALLWLVGRLAMYPALGLHRTPLVLAGAAFFIALGVAIALPLVAKRSYRNLPFLVILALFALADLAFLGSHLGWITAPPFDPLRSVANLVQLMVALIGGRIIPLFTRNALAKSGVTVTIVSTPWLDRAVLATLVGIVAVDVAWPGGLAAGALALLGALLLAARLGRWHGHRTLRMPIVWILHAGYAWLVVALVLKGAWLLAHVGWAADWLHGLTAGAFGTMILAVMTRVALGHSGRELKVPPTISAAYLLAIFGAALRVVGPMLVPAYGRQLLLAAAVFWALAFVIFIGVYLPIMVAPRVESR